MVNLEETFQLILKFQKLASHATVYLMIMECMPMKRLDVKHTMFVTMAAKIHSYAVLVQSLINASYTATTGTQSIVENQANTTAPMLTWEALNQSQDQHKLRRAPTSGLNRFHKLQSIDQLIISSAHNQPPPSETPNRFKKLTDRSRELCSQFVVNKTSLRIQSSEGNNLLLFLLELNIITTI